MESFTGIFDNIRAFVLILLRISGFVFVSPVFGRRGIPPVLKICFCMLMAYIVFSGYGPSISADSLDVLQLTILCVREVLIGIVFGFTTVIFFSVFYMAGQVLDIQMGFQLGSVYDPQLGERVPLTGNLIYTFAFITFIITGGHLKLIYMLYQMYETVPVMGGSITALLTNVVIGGFNNALLFAINMALPMVIMMMVCEFALGLMVRFVPQMNVFIVGIPIKILVGYMVMMFMIAPLSGLFELLFDSMFEFSQSVVNAIA